ncbi:MAG: RNA polymerase sigma factor [Polyangiaceae bacterium]|nr:RNA polymerase sigma factor [Polyangiaceae bacterium]
MLRVAHGRRPAPASPRFAALPARSPAAAVTAAPRSEPSGGATVELMAAPPAADDLLVERAKAGDTVAFRELFRRHRADVARVVGRMLSAQADVEDVVQEAFLQAYRSLKDFRAEARFSTWLYRVTVNVVLMHRRAARSRPVLTLPAEGVDPGDARAWPDDLAARNARLRAFARLLDRLSEKKRAVFVLHELEGKSPVEIAELVGAPVLTVRTRLFYARRELEAMLEQEPTLAGLGLGFAKEAS